MRPIFSWPYSLLCRPTQASRLKPAEPPPSSRLEALLEHEEGVQAAPEVFLAAQAPARVVVLDRGHLSSPLSWYSTVVLIRRRNGDAALGRRAAGEGGAKEGREGDGLHVCLLPCL
jgi:hypothetical protein